MSCYYHHEESAIAQCIECEKHLCKKCADKNHYVRNNVDFVLCKKCKRARLKQNLYYMEDKHSFILHIVIGTIFLALSIFISITAEEPIALFGCLLFFVPFGWFWGRNDTEDALWATGNVSWVSIILKYLFFFVKVAISAIAGIPLMIRDCVSLRKERIATIGKPVRVTSNPK